MEVVKIGTTGVLCTSGSLGSPATTPAKAPEFFEMEELLFEE